MVKEGCSELTLFFFCFAMGEGLALLVLDHLSFLMYPIVHIGKLVPIGPTLVHLLVEQLRLNIHNTWGFTDLLKRATFWPGRYWMASD